VVVMVGGDGGDIVVVVVAVWLVDHLRLAGVTQKPKNVYPVSRGFGGSIIWEVNPRLSIRAMSLPALCKKSCRLTP